MTRALVDLETSEVIKEINDNETIKIYNPNNLNKAKIGKKLFYRLYSDSLSIFSDKIISKQNLEIYFTLVKLLDFDKGEFVKLNGIPANIKQLSMYLEITSKTLTKHIKVLEKKELLKTIKNGRSKYVLINPYVINYGTKHTQESLDIFSSSVWAKQIKNKVRRCK